MGKYVDQSGLSRFLSKLLSIFVKKTDLMGGASSAADGHPGIVPTPGSGNQAKFLRGDATWATPAIVSAPTSTANGTAGLVPAPSSSWYPNRSLVFLNGNASWSYLPLQNNTTTTESYYALDARVGKTLNDSINSVNSAFTSYKSTIVRQAVASGTDLNTIQTSGFYRINANHANQPSNTSYGQLLVIQGGSDTIVQMVFPYNSTTFYVRVGNVVGNTSGSWTAWRTI